MNESWSFIMYQLNLSHITHQKKIVEVVNCIFFKKLKYINEKIQKLK